MAARPHAYVELLRPANVMTALADVIAGAAVAHAATAASVPWLLASTAGLYAGGVVLNDYFDRAIDAVERPERPIPSGRVAPGAAAALGGGLLLAGVGAAWTASATAGTIAAVIAMLVLLYDARGKHVPFAGPMNMGACRGANLLLGVAAVPARLPAAWPLGLLAFTYITAVTSLSKGEVRGGTRVVAIAAFSAIAAVIVALAVLAGSATPVLSLFIALALVVWLAWRVLRPFWEAVRDGRPDVIRRAIRAGILSLVILDAVLGAVYAGAFAAAAILAVGFVAGWLARRFAVT